MNNNLNSKILEKVQTKIAISNFEEKEKFSMPNNKILKTVASLVLVLGITCGAVYAGCKITGYFKIKGIDDSGIQTALENNYVQNIEMNYIEKEQVKFKVDYLMMDDINFDLVFNFVTQDEVDNYEEIAVTNLQITDENNKQIYIDSEEQDIWTKNISLSSAMWTTVEKQDHTLRQVLHLCSNNFPKSKKIYVSFDSVILYNVNKGNPITIIYKDNYKLEFDVSEQLVNRKSIEYAANNSKVEKAILTNSGFAITIKESNYIPKNANYIVKDTEGNSYTLSDTLRILKKPDLSQIEKQVLIFNITKYNESDSISLIKENGNIIEFIKK